MQRRLLIHATVLLSFVLTAAVLAYHYRELPSLVPLMVSPGGVITRVAPKSLLSVFRLWLMGVDAELLCVTVYRAVRRNPATGAPPVVRSAVALMMFLIAVKWVGTVFAFLDQALGSKRLHGAYVATSLLAVIALVAGSVTIFVRARRAGTPLRREDLRFSNRVWLLPLALCIGVYAALATFPSWLFGA
jgi:uncharacterized membrane protein